MAGLLQPHPFILLSLALLFHLASAVNITEFMQNKVWGCLANGATCFKLNPRQLLDCGDDAQGHVCRPGYYEALDGTCQQLSQRCYSATKNDSTSLEECLGCTTEDRPEGETVLGCLEQEATCLSNYNGQAECPVEQQRQICAEGFYRAMPENKCYRNANFTSDRARAKEGCQELLENSCGPNSHAVCVDAIAQGESYCALTGQQHDRPMVHFRAKFLHGGEQGEEERQCNYQCRCDRGYVRDSRAAYAKCITTQECLDREHHSCPNETTEEYVKCPRRVDIECDTLVVLKPACDMPEMLLQDFSGDEQCSIEGGNSSTGMCLSRPTCLCKRGYVRCEERCVSLKECMERRIARKVRTGRIESLGSAIFHPMDNNGTHRHKGSSSEEEAAPLGNGPFHIPHFPPRHPGNATLRSICPPLCAPPMSMNGTMPSTPLNNSTRIGNGTRFGNNSMAD